MARALQFPDKLSLVLIKASLLQVPYSLILTAFSIHHHRSHVMARRQTSTRNWCRNSRPSIPLIGSLVNVFYSLLIYTGAEIRTRLWSAYLYHIYIVAFLGSNIRGEWVLSTKYCQPFFILMDLNQWFRALDYKCVPQQRRIKLNSCHRFHHLVTINTPSQIVIWHWSDIVPILGTRQLRRLREKTMSKLKGC